MIKIKKRKTESQKSQAIRKDRRKSQANLPVFLKKQRNSLKTQFKNEKTKISHISRVWSMKDLQEIRNKQKKRKSLIFNQITSPDQQIMKKRKKDEEKAERKREQKQIKQRIFKSLLQKKEQRFRIREERKRAQIRQFRQEQERQRIKMLQMQKQRQKEREKENSERQKRLQMMKRQRQMEEQRMFILQRQIQAQRQIQRLQRQRQQERLHQLKMQKMEQQGKIVHFIWTSSLDKNNRQNQEHFTLKSKKHEEFQAFLNIKKKEEEFIQDFIDELEQKEYEEYQEEFEEQKQKVFPQNKSEKIHKRIEYRCISSTTKIQNINQQKMLLKHINHEEFEKFLNKMILQVRWKEEKMTKICEQRQTLIVQEKKRSETHKKLQYKCFSSVIKLKNEQNKRYTLKRISHKEQNQFLADLRRNEEWKQAKILNLREREMMKFKAIKKTKEYKFKESISFIQM